MDDISRIGTYSVYGISLLIAMNTQLVMITSITNRLKNVTRSTSRTTQASRLTAHAYTLTTWHESRLSLL